MISNAYLAEEGGSTGYIWIVVALLVVLVVVLLVVPMFTNKKRAKETNELHNSLRPGDVIKTVGGIIGTIVEIRQVSPTDKEMIIETGIGDNKTTMVFDIQALYQVLQRVELPAEQSAPVDEPAADSDGAEAIAAPVDEPAAEEVSAPAAEPEAEQAAVETKTEETVEDAPAPSEEPAEEPAAAEPEKKSAKKSTKK